MLQEKVYPQEPAGNGLDLFRDLASSIVNYQTALADRMGLNLTEFKCLGQVHRRGAMKPSDLAETMHLSRPAVTHIIDRLVERRLVSCQANDEDRRSITVVPTEKFLQQMERSYASMRSGAVKLHRQYTGDQCLLVIGYLKKSADLLERETAKIRSKRQPQPVDSRRRRQNG